MKGCAWAATAKPQKIIHPGAEIQTFSTVWMSDEFESTVTDVAEEGSEGFQGLGNVTASAANQVGQEGLVDIKDLVNTTADVATVATTGFRDLENTTLASARKAAHAGRGDLSDFANATIDVAQDGWSVVGNFTARTWHALEKMRLRKQLQHAMREEWGQIGRVGQQREEMEDQINSIIGAESPCPELDGLYIDKVVHSNLGGYGPDEGEPSLIFASNHTLGGLTLRTIDFRVTANSPYSPGTPWMNGLSHGLVGKYGMIVLEPGTSLNFTVRLLDSESGMPIRMPSFALTFFDLDEAVNNTEREFLTVGGFANAELTRNTEIKSTANRDGTTTFSASTSGNFEDNPVDPLLLTSQQKNRAITLTFKDVTEIAATIGAGEGSTSVSRGFTFVGHPVLACAKTLGPVDADAQDATTIIQRHLPVFGVALVIILSLSCVLSWWCCFA